MPSARPSACGQAARAEAIAAACAGKPGIVTEETKPTTQVSPLLYDLTSLQREANGRFGFSAQGHAVARAGAVREAQGADLPAHRLARAARGLPRHGQEDDGRARRGCAEFAPFAKQVLKSGWVKPNKRIFDNSKISDHFAIIPTLQAPGHLSEPEAKLYDLVVRRFLAVFFPSAEYLQTTRITRVGERALQDRGQGAAEPGWLAVYGKTHAGRDREPAADRRRARRSKTLEVEGDRQPDRAAGALHRGDAALGDGGRRQAGRGRRTARGHGGQGPRHAGDARGGHRGPDQREVRRSATAAS